MGEARAAGTRSLRARLTVGYSIGLGLTLVAFGAVLYAIFARTLLTRRDEYLADALNVFTREVNAERLVRGSPELSIGVTAHEIRFRSVIFVVRDPSGRLVVAGGGDEGEPRPSGADPALVQVALARPDTAPPATAPGERGGHRMITRAISVDGKPFVLTGILPLADVASTLERVRLVLLVAIPFFLAVSALGAYALAARGLAPVRAMSERAAAITAKTLHERLPVSGDAELVGLSRVVNELLDRVEGAFAQQRRFMADASHELRTPTASLRAEAEVTLSRPNRTEEEYRESLGVMLQSAKRLSRIVDDLFLLARADAGHLTMHHEAIYLEEIVHDVTRSVEQVAEQRGVHVELKSMTQAPMEGDADMLGRALLNLLDNAIKYSPKGGAVAVEMAARSGHHAISVVDEGPGIPPSEVETVFQRFHRGEVARERKAGSVTDGAGLGLSIARHIAIAHGGSLAVASSRPGRTEFVLLLPAREG